MSLLGRRGETRLIQIVSEALNEILLTCLFSRKERILLSYTTTSVSPEKGELPKMGSFFRCPFTRAFGYPAQSVISSFFLLMQSQSRSRGGRWVDLRRRLSLWANKSSPPFPHHISTHHTLSEKDYGGRKGEGDSYGGRRNHRWTRHMPI